MSRDIFAYSYDVGSPSDRTSWGLFGGPDSESQNSGSATLVPRPPEMQRLVDEINAEREIERARKEIEMNTPENRQKAAEAEAAERERKRINFDFARTMNNNLDEGWKQLLGGRTDEEIRVYTTDYRRRRFWGIKPAGMDIDDFWEQNDPEVRRWNDNIAVTWADPLRPPPVTAHDEDNPDIWVGRGINPDSIPSEPPTATSPPPTKASKSRKRQKKPAVNPNHRVRKSTPPAPKISKKHPRKSSANRADARQSKVDEQLLAEAGMASASSRPSRNKTNTTPSNAQHEPEINGDRPSKHPQGRPGSNANPTPNDIPPPPKRPRGRPPKPKPAANNADPPPPKRPRGRPPGKGKPSPVQGNAKVTKSSQTQRRPSAPSNHKMRTRGKGTAELLQLP